VSELFDTLRGYWFVACTSSELRRRPLARTVLGVPIVLFRSDGRAAALVDRCPHRNAALSEGRLVGELLECPYHGWAFDAAGVCQRLPAWPAGVPRPTRQARAVDVCEQDQLLWVYLGATGAPPPPLPPRLFPAPDDPAFDSFGWVSDARCTLVDGLENLLDATHPSFVHAGLVRWAARRRPVSVDVRRTAACVEAVYTENAVASGLLPRLLEGPRTVSIGRYFPPSTAQLEYRGPAGPRLLLTAMFTPTDEQRVLVHAVVATPRGRLPAVLKRAALRVAFAQVVRQDRGILARQQANVARFGGPAFSSTPLDVMRPHILHFLSRPPGEPVAPYAATLRMEL
jgi:phenylpropionate dioxygenase-like ring-hydroxylating dioxygenase large terminal subunit